MDDLLVVEDNPKKVVDVEEDDEEKEKRQRMKRHVRRRVRPNTAGSQFLFQLYSEGKYFLMSCFRIRGKGRRSCLSLHTQTSAARVKIERLYQVALIMMDVGVASIFGIVKY